MHRFLVTVTLGRRFAGAKEVAEEVFDPVGCALLNGRRLSFNSGVRCEFVARTDVCVDAMLLLGIPVCVNCLSA